MRAPAFWTLFLSARLACALDYPVVDTNQKTFFDDRTTTTAPQSSQDPYFGQDAQYEGNAPSLVDNEDGTVSDEVTGLQWTKAYYGRMTWQDAMDSATGIAVGGYSDWRIPTIKELYSLIDFQGKDISQESETSSTLSDPIPFIDNEIFDFAYGGDSQTRLIDVQFVTNASYVDASHVRLPEWFGVNFADGRIKGYSKRPANFFVRYVRGSNDQYGKNDLMDNGDGTISDAATGLMWARQDSQEGLDWASALEYCESLTLAGYNDFRLPNAKELHSLVDYTRGPVTTESPAIDPIFDTTSMINENGDTDWPYFWSSTTHKASTGQEGGAAVYICFGRCMGNFQGQWQDIHGAGAQRSDFKTGDPNRFPNGNGPQGDAVRIFNYARCVRTEEVGIFDDQIYLAGNSTANCTLFCNETMPEYDVPADIGHDNMDIDEVEEDSDTSSVQKSADTVCEGCQKSSNAHQAGNLRSSGTRHGNTASLLVLLFPLMVCSV